jgi:hypothetical protein
VAFGDDYVAQRSCWIRAPVAIVAQSPEILTVNPGVPANSPAEICPPYKSL